MFMELYKFSKLVMYLNSCSMDLGRDTQPSNSFLVKKILYQHSQLSKHLYILQIMQ